MLKEESWTSFVAQVEEWATKAEFSRVADEILDEVLGRPIKSILMRWAGCDLTQDPALFEKQLRLVLGEAAEDVLDCIIGQLKSRSLERLARSGLRGVSSCI